MCFANAQELTLAIALQTDKPQFPAMLEGQEKRALVTFLREAMAATKLDATNLARKAEVDPSTLSRHLDPRWMRAPTDATLRKISAISGVTVPKALTVRKTAYSHVPNSGEQSEIEARRATFSPPIDGDVIPLRSAGRGGDEQEMFLADGPIGYVPRPQVLRGVNGAYGVYLVGDSMVPRYYPGCTLWVNPFLMPRAHSGVICVKKNDAVMVKEFVRRERGQVVLRQFNPPLEIFVPEAEIAELHVIAGTDERQAG